MSASSIPAGGPAQSYDVFLSYSREDLELVTRIAHALKTRQIAVWFDQWNLAPGDTWQSELETAIVSSKAVAVVIGQKGLGAWEQPEMRAAIDRSVNRRARVIPVLLPGVSATDDRIPLLLRNYQCCVVDDQVKTTDIDRLIWGITGQNPLQQRTQEYQAQQPASPGPNPAEMAVESLAKHLTSGNITFFFGRSAAHPTANNDVTSKLLSDLGLIEKDSDKLMPPLDLAASFFAVKHGDADLEDRVVDIMSRQNDAMPAAYTALARLQEVLAKRQAIRGRKQFKQLLISNNLDILLEKALLLQGVAFTRLVQLRSSSKMQINTIASVLPMADGRLQLTGADGRATIVDPNDEPGLGAAISDCGTRIATVQGGTMVDDRSHAPILVSELREPILYKLQGSQDVPKSCAISTEQYFDTLWRSIDQKCIPDELATIISNTPVLFAGSRILDADFRLSYTLLRSPLESGTDQARFAVLERGAGDDRDGSQKVTKSAWDELSAMALRKYSIQMLDQHEDRFFRSLTQAFLARGTSR
jgi:hypothetical protein